MSFRSSVGWDVESLDGGEHFLRWEWHTHGILDASGPAYWSLGPERITNMHVPPEDCSSLLPHTSCILYDNRLQDDSLLMSEL